MAAPVVATGSNASGGAPTKSKRVRTGCLTCRERHLKCDEGVPDCMNCRKSNRECKRGVRLNFIDVQVKALPYTPPTKEWSVRFEDESRLIASEYQGGLSRYAPFNSQAITPPRESDLDIALRQQRSSNADPRSGIYAADSGKPVQVSYPPLVTKSMSVDYGYEEAQIPHLGSRKNSDASFMAMGGAQGMGGGSNFSLASIQDQFSLKDDAGPRTHAYRTSDVSSVASSMVPQGVGPPSSASFRSASGAGHPNVPDGLMTPPSEKANGEREYLSSPEEILYMKVFVEEVGVWMDSLDKEKHFSRIIPYLALKSPMLLNAFLACGVKHLTLVHPEKYRDDKALFYYDTATTQLLRSLQNPDRNTAECATTAVVLNVYEIMSEKPNQRMSHIAGARALIRECGWNAESKSIGAACFWLNIGMEVLSCLAFNWQTAWDPDQWGLNLNILNSMDSGDGTDQGADKITEGGTIGGSVGGGLEELWIHRIFYIIAKIANFRASTPKFQEPSPHDEAVRLQNRFAEWQRLKGLCDMWNNNCPRSMRPFGYAMTRETTRDTDKQSLFPNIWLPKRAAVLGRLFYHTAMVLLHQINPRESPDSIENQKAQKHHARQVCGIVAHTQDRGIASVAIRSLAIGGGVLKERREQEEVMDLFHKIKQNTGWRVGKVQEDLAKTWNWDKRQTVAPAAMMPVSSMTLVQQPVTSGPPAPPHFPVLQHTAPSPIAALTSGSSMAPLPAPAPQVPRVHPLLAQADFGLPNHPYSNFYAPPNRTNASTNLQSFWPG